MQNKINTLLAKYAQLEDGGIMKNAKALKLLSVKIWAQIQKNKKSKY